MPSPRIERISSHGLKFLGDPAHPGGVTFAFTERTGGVSQGPFVSLNLGDACGDDLGAVNENRRRALCALGAENFIDNLVNPKQVHGDHIVLISSSEPDELASLRAEARRGADAIVCVTSAVPVLLCYADCVPIVLACDGGFAVIHSGWRGTVAHIAAKALRMLVAQRQLSPADVFAYIGPHIGRDDYEVSIELAQRFQVSFGTEVCCGRYLDLGYAVRATLIAAGIPVDHIVSVDISTAQATKRFFSYRGEGGTCGRHGALAFL